MLRFENQEDFVELNLAEQETADLQSKGDAYVTVRVSADGFSGHNDLWVLAPALRSFCQSLVALERDRRGQAVLESVLPEELRIVVRSVDSCGHMLVEGSTGYQVQREHSRPWHSIAFGFEFDPSQLVRAMSVGWVTANAELDAPPDGDPAERLDKSGVGGGPPSVS